MDIYYIVYFGSSNLLVIFVFVRPPSSFRETRVMCAQYFYITAGLAYVLLLFLAVNYHTVALQIISGVAGSSRAAWGLAAVLLVFTARCEL